MSIMMASIPNGSLSRKRSTASWPLRALMSVAPSSPKMNSLISMLSSLSSATRILSPLIEATSASLGLEFSLGSDLSISKGTITSKVVPTPFSLSTLTLPPMASTMLLTMDMPRPVPPYSERAVSPSCAKGSNRCSMNSFDMPTPVSRHLNCIRAVSPSDEISRQVM